MKYHYHINVALIISYTQNFKINSDPNGQSQGKGKTFSSPFFLCFWVFKRSKIKINNRTPKIEAQDAQDTPQPKYPTYCQDFQDA